MRTKQLSKEVLVADDRIVQVGRKDIELLKEYARQNERKRMRLCAHKGTDDRLHEMLIVLRKGAYIRPHKHLNKTESFHIIEGLVDVVFFDEAGNVTDVVCMGDYSSGRTFYYRLSQPRFHTVLIRSDVAVFHETTNGPFDRADSIVAPWSPEENDHTASERFMEQVAQAVENLSV